MSRLDLTRKLVFLFGALGSIAAATLPSSWAADPFDIDACRWALLWLGIPIIGYYIVTEIMARWLRSTPMTAGEAAVLSHRDGHSPAA